MLKAEDIRNKDFYRRYCTNTLKHNDNYYNNIGLTQQNSKTPIYPCMLLCG